MNQSVGKFIIKSKGQGVDMCLWLYNFAINDDNLKREHRKALNTYVFPVLVAGGSVTIVGMASRTGSNQHNLSLSRRRALSVSKHLSSYAGSVANRLRQVYGAGEYIAAAFGSMANDTESGLYRATVVTVWSKSTPPPPPTPQDATNIYQCKISGGEDDPKLVDRINNQERWLIKGAQGDAGQLYRFIRGFESEMSQSPTPGEKRLLEFYRTPFFYDWFVKGTCGIIEKYPMEQIARWLTTYLTKEGLKNAAITRKLIKGVLRSLGPQ